MIDVIKFRYKFWRLQGEKNRIARLYSKAIREVKKQPNHADEEESLILSSMSDQDIVGYDINDLITRHLIMTAKKLMLPVPTHNEKEMWRKEYIDANIWWLSPKGISELRSAIRNENKERREPVIFWGSLAFGFIGSVTGLVSTIVG